MSKEKVEKRPLKEGLKRRRFTDEFKADAVQMLLTGCQKTWHELRNQLAHGLRPKRSGFPEFQQEQAMDARMSQGFYEIAIVHLPEQRSPGPTGGRRKKCPSHCAEGDLVRGSNGLSMEGRSQGDGVYR